MKCKIVINSPNKKYEQLRIKSRDEAQGALLPNLKDLVSLTEINNIALAKAKLWEENVERSDDAVWSWCNGARRYAYSNPKRLDLAIWFANTQLCGLSIGKPTYSGSGMRLDVVEGAPEVHPLKRQIVGITIVAFEAYAHLIGANQIRLMRPLNHELVRYYEGYGFTFKQGKKSNTPTYLWKNL